MMQFELIPAACVASELMRKITLATFDHENEWFFL